VGYWRAVCPSVVENVRQGLGLGISGHASWKVGLQIERNTCVMRSSVMCTPLRCNGVERGRSERCSRRVWLGNLETRNFDSLGVVGDNIKMDLEIGMGKREVDTGFWWET
jgi:hypothetical protein